MIVEYIRYRIPAERAEQFADAYARSATVLDADKHCLDFEATRGIEEPQHWVVRIKRDSLEGHQQGFREAAHFKEFFAAVRPLFDTIEEMKHYRVELRRAERTSELPG